MSLLTIVQGVTRLLSIPTPSVVVTSTDPQVQQLYALANEEGQELARDEDQPWQQLLRQQTFVTVAQAEQTDAIPTDFESFIPNSFFNRTTRRELIGPITPQMWQAIQAQPQLNRVFLAYRMRDNAFLITPDPTADETIAYEYITKNWVLSAADVEKDSFTADTDTSVIPERLIQLGLRWRWLSAKGLDYAEAFRTYEYEKQKAKAKSGGSTKLDMTGRNLYNCYGFPNLPLGNFPG